MSFSFQFNTNLFYLYKGNFQYRDNNNNKKEVIHDLCR